MTDDAERPRPQPPKATGRRLLCPGCDRPLTVNARPHCEPPVKCLWLQCRKCATVYDTSNGHHYGTRPTKEMT